MTLNTQFYSTQVILISTTATDIINKIILCYSDIRAAFLAIRWIVQISPARLRAVRLALSDHTRTYSTEHAPYTRITDKTTSYARALHDI